MHTSLFRPAIPVGASLLFLACSQASPPTSPPTEQLPSLEWETVARVGGIENRSAVLGSVNSGVILPSGGFVLADGQARQIVFFDASGLETSRTGVEGNGPGDFRALRDIGVIDDQICVYDIQFPRVTVLSLSGDVIDVFGIPIDSIESVRPSVQGFTPGCGVVVSDRLGPVGEHGAVTRDTVRFFAIAPDYGPTRRIAHALDAPERWHFGESSSGSHATILGGRVISAFANGELFVGVTDARGITVVSAGADALSGSIEFVGLSTVPVDPAVEARVRDTVAEWEAGRMERSGFSFSNMDEWKDAIRAGVAAAPVADSVPLFSGLETDGSIFLLQEPDLALADGITRWRVHDRSGCPIGTFDFPSDDVDVLDVNGDFLLVDYPDELGAPEVSLIRVDSRSGCVQ